jgi:hypothetical protein
MGTAATTTLTALQFQQGGAGLLPADIATIDIAIINDILIAGSGQGVTGQAWSGAGISPSVGSFHVNGLLVVPNRGVLQMIPGDWVAVDSLGWPVLISGNSAGTGGSGNWRHS